MTGGPTGLGHALLFTLIPVTATAIELLPSVLEQAPGAAIAGFAAGIAVTFGMRGLTVVVERRPAR